MARLVALCDSIHLIDELLDGRAFLVLGGGEVVGLKDLAGGLMDLVDSRADIGDGGQLASVDFLGVGDTAQGDVGCIDGVQFGQRLGEAYGCHIGGYFA